MEPNRIYLKEEPHFLLVGGGDFIKVFIKKALQYLDPRSLLIISHQQSDQDWSYFEKTSIEQIAKDHQIPILFPQKVCTPEIYKIIKERRLNIGLVMGSKWIFTSEFCDLFEGRLFNCHISKLPAFRGAGSFSWQVLNRVKEITITVHQLIQGIDEGDILLQKSKKAPEENLHQQFHKGLYELSQELSDELLDIFLNQKSYQPECQNQKIATYFPLLYHKINGAIDLSWSKKDIDLFIRAFGPPYGGAFLYHKEEKIFILESEISKRKEKFHPYASGVIINKTEKYLEIATNDGSLYLHHFKNEQGESVPISQFRVGSRFYIKYEALEASRSFRPKNKV